MFDILAMGFLVGTALMVAFVLFLGWQQMRIDRAEMKAAAARKAQQAEAALPAGQVKGA